MIGHSHSIYLVRCVRGWSGCLLSSTCHHSFTTLGTVLLYVNTHIFFSFFLNPLSPPPFRLHDLYGCTIMLMH